MAIKFNLAAFPTVAARARFLRRFVSRDDWQQPAASMKRILRSQGFTIGDRAFRFIRREMFARFNRFDEIAFQPRSNPIPASLFSSAIDSKISARYQYRFTVNFFDEETGRRKQEQIAISLDTRISPDDLQDLYNTMVAFKDITKSDVQAGEISDIQAFERTT